MFVGDQYAFIDIGDDGFQKRLDVREIAHAFSAVAYLKSLKNPKKTPIHPAHPYMHSVALAVMLRNMLHGLYLCKNLFISICYILFPVLRRVCIMALLLI